MYRLLIVFFLINFHTPTLSSIKDDVISKMQNTNNFSFNFEQNINGKVETGNCIVEYPKKIFCKYKKANNKILVSNGKILAIKTREKISLEFKNKIETNISKIKNYCKAEEYHQKFIEKKRR